jgi:hypothetical protein
MASSTVAANTAAPATATTAAPSSHLSASHLPHLSSSKMMKFFGRKTHQPNAERIKVQKELFGFSKVSESQLWKTKG